MKGFSWKTTAERATSMNTVWRWDGAKLLTVMATAQHWPSTDTVFTWNIAKQNFTKINK